MKASVLRAYVKEADRQESYGPEQYGLIEDEGLARRVFARATPKHFRKAVWNYPAAMRIREYVSNLPPGRFSQRQIADSLGVSPSTVSRAITRDMADGRYFVIAKPGRYGGTWKPSIPTPKLAQSLMRKAREKLKRWRFLREKWARFFERLSRMPDYYQDEFRSRMWESWESALAWHKENARWVSAQH